MSHQHSCIVYMCFCLYVSDEIDAIKLQLNKDQDELLISSFCKPRLYSPEAAVSDERYSPRVTWFDLSDAACNMVDLFCKWKDSAVFQEIWKAQLRQVTSKGNKLTVGQIEQSIWKLSKITWEAFCRGMVGTRS